MSIVRADTWQNANGVAYGAVLQVKQTVMDTDIFYSAPNSWTDITGLSAVITPKDINSRILIMSTVMVGQGAATNDDYSVNLAVTRNGSLLSYNSLGNHGYGEVSNYHSNVDNLWSDTFSFTRLDSPASATALTYQIQIRSSGPGWGTNPIYVNRQNRFDDAWYATSRARSTITLMEVAG
jgi:hypothetical protein